MAALSSRLRGSAPDFSADRHARRGVQLGGSAGDAFRPDLSQRPHLQFRARRRCGVPGAQRIHGAAPEVRVRGARAADHASRSSSTPPSVRATNGTAAGSTIASLPSGCGRCAASSCSGIAAPDPPGTRDQPGAEALDRLVCERRLAGDGLPLRRASTPARAACLAEAIAESRGRAAGRLSRAQRASDRDARPPAGTDRHACCSRRRWSCRS